jgi:hypothetical protein
LLDIDGTTLLDLPRFLRDKRFRESILAAVTDDMRSSPTSATLSHMSMNGESVPPFTMRTQPPATRWREDIADRIRATACRPRLDQLTSLSSAGGFVPSARSV